MTSSIRERLKRHLVLFSIAVAVAVLAIPWTEATGENQVMGGPPDVVVSLTLGTAYASLIFLTATLLIGPYYLIRSKHPPLQLYLRRDLGIWAAITALGHSVLSFLINYGPLSAWDMFFFRDSSGAFTTLRTDVFGVMNYLGLLAALIFVLLLLLSSDRSFEWLKAKRWKSLQKWAYPATLLTLLHGVFYQFVAQRSLGFVLLLGVLTLLMALGQFMGVFKRISAGKT